MRSAKPEVRKLKRSTKNQITRTKLAYRRQACPPSRINHKIRSLKSEILNPKPNVTINHKR